MPKNRKKKLVKLSFPEDTCRRCGRCCFGKWEDSKGVVHASRTFACEFLDRQTNLCMIYPIPEYRRALKPECQTTAESLVKRVLPPDCAYVKNIPNYKSAIDDWEE